ncbi:ABC transporter permease [Spirosoma utsteinense]|uniref:ABC transport system permease protein n=1 Tax=Spirosoma utsteinense TaxID=2585773 RepID=A0ABR6WDR6_9BACT|nr:FtsX-like permease family protein [Spirosoma utsteinense]MBC3786951.1 putative ABC transport system permease protein [Spirosoma utsteinense]MBC3794067.1 putative ABC transport system permease protein [Spirosoma utsteinense]
MLTNYLKIALRIFRKDTTFSLINVVGLATGLAVALLIIQYVRFELSYEKTNPLANRIVRLTLDYMNGGTVNSQDTETNPPVGPKARREMSEVVNYTRAYPIGEPNVTVQIGEKYYLVDNVFAVDSSFFSMFNYPLLRGSRTNLFTRPRQVVLTKTMALTYFNTLEVLGKTLKIPKPENTVLLEVVGVVPDSPANTHLKFDMLFSYPTMLSDFNEREDNWDGNNTLTYLQLADNASYEGFTKSLVAFNNRLISEKKVRNHRVIGQKIGDIHLYSHKNFETEPNGEARSVYFLLGVAFLVLLSALVNYVNLTTSKALDRAREIGMRKVVGSTQNQIRTQIFIETVLVNVVAGALSVGLVVALRPVFVEVAGLPEGFTVFRDVFFWESVGAFLLLSVVLSGFYPAFVLSSFDPIAVLKGNFSRSTKGVFLRKSLVVFQFAITLILLVQTFAVYRQVNFLRQQNLGVNMDRTLVVKAPVGNKARKDYDTFRQMLLNQSQVKAVSLSGTVPGMGSTQMNTTTGINLSDVVKKTSYNYYLTQIDTSFIGLMGIKLLAGKNFDATTRPGFADTTDRQLIVNEETLRLWEIPTPEEAIGKRVDLWGRKATIRGVVKNYHYESPKAAYIPIIHMYSPTFDSFASVKFAGGNAKEQLATLKTVYEANFPYSPFSYFFMDSEYDKQYKADDRFQQVFGALTGFAILISCLGLFGLATFTVSKRTKEIGIRKVIGASTTNLMILLSKDFIKTALLAILIGLPVTYFLVINWLANYAARIELSWWLFAAPALFILLLVLVSIGSKTIATALMNPVKSLRSE